MIVEPQTVFCGECLAPGFTRDACSTPANPRRQHPLGHSRWQSRPGIAGQRWSPPGFRGPSAILQRRASDRPRLARVVTDVFDLGPARAASQDDFGAMADQHHGETLPRIQPYVAPDQEPPRGFDVCRLLARVFLGSSPRRLASTLLLSLRGTFRIAGEGFAFGIGLHQMMNQRAGMTRCARQSRQATVSGIL